MRAWHWPSDADWPIFIALGIITGLNGQGPSAASRRADAAITTEPFGDIGLPLAILWD